MWRWDQGRLTYFSVEKIRLIASALYELNNSNLKDEVDPLREFLPKITGLPFKPESYRVWRNYARVFKVLGLASNIDGVMVCTDLCKQLISIEDTALTYDEYIHYVARIFYYPSPIFNGYNTFTEQKFPFSAILKLLISRIGTNDIPSVNIDDITKLLIANNVTGLEDIYFYRQLKPENLLLKGDQKRQVREMLVFISQLSYLSWENHQLFLDSFALSNLSTEELLKLATPIAKPRQESAELEVLNMYGKLSETVVQVDLKEPVSNDDILFTEGKKIRVSHLRTERNRKLIKHYFDSIDNPYLCDVCNTQVKDRYPWINNLIEVHHILPLSSPLHVDSAGTSLNDLVGVCPNCHRATHAYYRFYLSNEKIPDFRNKDESKFVYNEVKKLFVNS